MEYSEATKPCRRCKTAIPARWQGTLCLQCQHPDGGRAGYPGYGASRAGCVNRCGYSTSELHALATRVDCARVFQAQRVPVTAARTEAA